MDAIVRSHVDNRRSQNDRAAARFHNGGKEDRHKNGDDSDDDEQLDEREGTLRRSAGARRVARCGKSLPVAHCPAPRSDPSRGMVAGECKLTQAICAEGGARLQAREEPTERAPLAFARAL